MGCNCGKKKKPVRPSKAEVQKQQKKDEPSKQSFELSTRSGRTLTYGSRLEAEAANVRAGRTGTIRRV